MDHYWHENGNMLWDVGSTHVFLYVKVLQRKLWALLYWCNCKVKSVYTAWNISYRFSSVDDNYTYDINWRNVRDVSLSNDIIVNTGRMFPLSFPGIQQDWTNYYRLLFIWNVQDWIIDYPIFLGSPHDSRSVSLSFLSATHYWTNVFATGCIGVIVIVFPIIYRAAHNWTNSFHIFSRAAQVGTNSLLIFSTAAQVGTNSFPTFSTSA
jgi:hypothetical protein